jgi:hypothetical protein
MKVRWARQLETDPVARNRELRVSAAILPKLAKLIVIKGGAVLYPRLCVRVRLAERSSLLRGLCRVFVPGRLR